MSTPWAEALQSWKLKFPPLGPNDLKRSQSLLAIAFGREKYIAAGFWGRLEVSSDVNSWTDPIFFSEGSFYGITHGSNGWTLVGGRPFGFGPIVLHSPDGVDWKSYNVPAPSTLQAVTEHDGLTVAVGNVGAIITSHDGITWTTRSSGSATLRSVISWPNGIVAVGDEGTIVTSEDGVSWTQMRVEDRTDLNAVAFGSETFVAVGESGTILRSTDAANWIPSIVDRTASYNGIAFGYGYFVVVGTDGKILISHNGKDWASQEPQTSSDLHSVAFGEMACVAVGDNSVILVAEPKNEEPPYKLSVIDDKVALSVKTKPGRWYLVEYKDTLQDSYWIPLKRIQAIDAESIINDVANKLPKSRYYRIRAESDKNDYPQNLTYERITLIGGQLHELTGLNLFELPVRVEIETDGKAQSVLLDSLTKEVVNGWRSESELTVKETLLSGTLIRHSREHNQISEKTVESIDFTANTGDIANLIVGITSDSDETVDVYYSGLSSDFYFGFIDTIPNYSLDDSARDSDNFFLRQIDDHKALDIYYKLHADPSRITDVRIEIYREWESFPFETIRGQIDASDFERFATGEDLHVVWSAPSGEDTGDSSVGGFYRVQLVIELSIGGTTRQIRTPARIAPPGCTRWWATGNSRMSLGF